MVFYSHSTALSFLVRRAILGNPCDFPAAPFGPSDCPFPSQDEVIAKCPMLPPEAGPIHVSVSAAKRRPSTERIAYHYVSNPLPKGSYLTAARGCAVASPELLFVQIGSSLDRIHQIAFGNVLCSAFIPMPEDADMRGFCQTEPMAEPKRLESFVSRAGRLKGIAQARMSAAYITPGAASPREAALAMMLTLPSALGGYGFAKPELNGTVQLPPKMARTFGRRCLRADMLWRDERVAIEYDSDQWHTGEERIAHDSRRRNLLKSLGYDVITVTNREIKQPADRERIVGALAVALGRRMRTRSQGAEAKRRELANVVLDPGFFSGLLLPAQ